MRFVCVTGMHRGGTSMVARLVNLLGVDLGDEGDHVPGGPANPRGYWEHAAMVEVADDILDEVFHARWHRVPVLADGFELDRALDPYRQRASDILRSAFPPDTELAGWKDPRASLLLPFWRTVTPVDREVLVVRRPDAVIGSIVRRDGFSPAHVADLWIRYTVAAIHHARDPLLVVHEQVFADLDRQLDRLAQHLGTGPVTDEARRDAHEFVSPELRRAESHRAPDGDAVLLARALYDLLQQEGMTTTTRELATHLHRSIVQQDQMGVDKDQLGADLSRVERELARAYEDQRTLRARAEEARKQAEAAARERTAELEQAKREVAEQARARRELEAQLREGERTRADAERRLGQARRDMERLRNRRSVKLALGAAEPFKPVFGWIRSRRGGSGSSAPPARHDAARDPSPARRTAARRATASEQAALERRLLATLPQDLPGDGPSVSIVVVNRDGAAHLRRLLPVLATTDYDDVELVVVDNGSTDESRALLSEWSSRLDVTVLANEDNRTFSDANNQGIAAARGELLLLLNNDIVPLGTAWLARMVETLQSQQASVVGARLVYPARPGLDNQGDLDFDDLTLQHRGIDFVTRGRGIPSPRNLGPGEDPLSATAADVRQRVGVTAACLLATREALDAVDGLTSGYVYGTEDVDLGLKVLADGGTIIYDGQAVAWHHEYGTQNAAGRERKRQNRLANRELFVDRWGPQLFREVLLDKLAGAGRWSDEPLHLAVTLTHDDESRGWGDYYTAHELGDAFASLGFRVSYAERYGDHWYDLDPSVDVLVCLLDAIDLHRLPRDVVTVAWVRNWTDRWISHPWFEDYDVVFASSTVSKQMIEDRTSQVARLLPLATNPERFRPCDEVDDVLADVAFVGNYWEKERDIIPALPCVDDDVDVKVWGKGWEKVATFRRWHQGTLPYERLNEVYNAVRVVLDDTAGPTKPYAAVNSRVFDALAAGAIVLSDNPVGVREVFDDEFPTWTSGEELAARVRWALEQPEEAAALAARYREAVLRDHTYRRRAEQIRDALVDWCAAPRFGVCVGIPDREQAEAWGDYHYGRAVQRELQRAGHPTRLHLLPEWEQEQVARDDVVVHLFGLSELRTRPSQVNVLWNISHPEKVTPQMLRRYDVACVASDRFAADLASTVPGLEVHALHQAADVARFRPDAEGPAHEVLFVANSRRTRRRILDDLLPSPHDVAVYGRDWTPDLVDPAVVRGDHVPNDRLAGYYANAAVVLNDHWDDMRAHGFLSNRLYDALASGACVVSDHVEGIDEAFDGAVVTYRDRQELADAVQRLLADEDERRRRGERGRQAVIERHTFEHRVARLLELVGDHLAAHRARVVPS